MPVNWDEFEPVVADQWADFEPVSDQPSEPVPLPESIASIPRSSEELFLREMRGQDEVAAGLPPAPPVLREPGLGERASMIRQSPVGRELLGPTDLERQLMESGQIAGPPGGAPGVLPLALSSPYPLIPGQVDKFGKMTKFGKGVLGYFAAQQVQAAPDVSHEVGESVRLNDPGRGFRAVIPFALQSGMLAGGLHGALEPRSTLKEIYASRQREAAPIYGDVRNEPIIREGPLSTQEGGAGVHGERPQAPQGEVSLSPEQSYQRLLEDPSLVGKAYTEGGVFAVPLGGKRVAGTAGENFQTRAEAQAVADRLKADNPEGFKDARPKPEYDELGKLVGYDVQWGKDLDEFPTQVSTGRALGYKESEILSHIGHGLSPEDIAYLNDEREAIDNPVEVVQAGSANDPFAKARAESPGGLTGDYMTIDRPNNRIVVLDKEFSNFLNQMREAGATPEQIREQIRSDLNHEQIHLKTPDIEALDYWNGLSRLEQYLNQRRYEGANRIENPNPTNMGHEALRFRIQQASGMTPSEFLQMARGERWTWEGLTALEKAVRGIREHMTDPGKEQRAIFDRVLGNIDAVKAAAGGEQPAARSREDPEAIARKTIEELESDAAKYRSAGQSKDADELERYAATLKQAYPGWNQESFPAARNRNSAYTGDELFPTDKVRAASAFARMRGALEDPRISDKTRKDLRKLDEIGTVRPGDEEVPPAARNRSMGKREEERATLRRKLYDLKLAAQAEAAGQPLEQPNLVKPVGEGHVSAEEAGTMPRLAGSDVEAKAKAYLEGQIKPIPASQESLENIKGPRPGVLSHKAPRPKFDRASFDEFADWAKRNLEGVRPEQLRDIWIDSVWNHLLGASGERLAEWRNALGLEHNYGRRTITSQQKLPDTFPNRADRNAQIASQKYRSKVVTAIARRLIKESTEGRASLDRQEVSIDDVDFYNNKTKYGAFREIRPEESKDPKVLKEILRDQARATEFDPESASRRLLLLLDKQTGKVELVSTYNDAGRQMVTDPAGPRVKGRFSRELTGSFLRRYQPVSTILVKDPVRAFRQSFNTVGEFMDKIGEEAANRASVGEWQYPGEGPAIGFKAEGTQGLKGEGGLVTGPGSAAARAMLRVTKGTFDDGGPITDTEVGGILNHVIDEVGRFEGSDDVRLSLEALADKAASGKLKASDRLAISGYRKAFKALEAKFPNAAREDLIDQLAEQIYENHTTAKDYEAFVKKGLAQFTAKGSGNVAGQEPPAARARRLKEAGRIVTDAIRNTGSSYDEWMVNRIARKGGQFAQVASEGFRGIIDREKALYGSLTPVLDPARRAAGQFNRATTWLHGLKKVTPFAATSRTVGAIENTIPVPAHAQPLVDMARNANIDIGRMAFAAAGQGQATGKFQRNPTATGYDAVRQGSGDLLRKWMMGLAKANIPRNVPAGTPRVAPLKQVKEMFRTWKEALDTPGVDPAVLDKINQDFVRQFPNVITHVRSGGRWQQVVHADLFNYLENAARRATHISAFRKEFPNNTAGKRVLRDVVDTLRSELDADGQKDLDAMLRTMQGHPSDNYSNMGMLSPTEPVGSAFRVLNQTVGNVMAKMVLTGQMLTQPGELIAGSTPQTLGMKNYLRGMARLRQIYPQLEEAGAVNRVMYDMTYDPTSPIRSLFRQSGNVMSRAFGEQMVNELQEAGAAAAAHVVSERIRTGALTDWERRNLPATFSEMGFKTTEVGLLMSGDPQMLGQFERMAASFLTSGNKAISEGSRLGANRLFNSIFRFQLYPMMKTNQFRQVAGNFSEAWTSGTPAERASASERMARFVGYNTLQGALTVAITTLGYMGWSGAKVRSKEAEDEPFKFMVESFMSSMSGPLYLVWRGSRDKGVLGVGEQATRLVFPYTVTRELIDMANGHGQYRDQSTFDRIGRFLSSKTPGTKVLGTGLAIFGLGNENRDLDTAISAFYRWRRQELGFREQEDFLNQDNRKAFRTAMRKVVEALKAADGDKFLKTYTDAMASVEGIGPKNISQSLRARKLLKTPDGKALDLDQKQALRNRIGDEAVDRLEYFDLMLEAAAGGHAILNH